MKNLPLILSRITAFFALSFTCFADSTNVIAPGQTLTNGITVSLRTNRYIFPASSNDTVRVLAARTSGTGAIGVRLIAPDGSSSGVDSRPDDAVALLSAVKLNKTGDYQIIVWDLFGTLSFEYGITLIKTPGTNQIDSDLSGGAILPGETKLGAIGDPADIDVYSFTASSNDTVKVLAVRTGGALSTIVGLQLMTPDGVVLGVDQRGEDAVAYFEALRLTQSGTYQLLVWDTLTGIQGFNYAVTLVMVPGTNQIDSDLSGGVIRPGETKLGAIGLPADIDVYSFTASSNDTVKVLAVRTAGPAFSTVGIQILSSGGLALGTDERPEDAVAYFNSLKLPRSGEYQMLVWSIPPPNTLYPTQTLNYALSLIKNTGPNVTDPDGGLVVSDHKNSGRATVGDLDAFEFLGLMCQDIQAELTNHSGGASTPVIELQSPNGEILAVATGTSRARLAFRGAPSSGTYLISVRDSNGANAFDYDLTISLTPKPPTFGPDGPQVVVSLCTNQVVLTWLISASSYHLESATNLNLPIIWTPAGQPLGELGAQLYFAEPRTLPQKYYRLHQQ